MKNIFAVIIVIALIAGAFYLTRRDSDTKDTSMKNVDATREENLLDVTAETVTYGDGMSGYAAKPKNNGNVPGVVMIHEWWGLNENIKDMARQLAGLGYAVLAVDLYNGSVATTSDEARALMAALDQKAATENLKAAVAYLRNNGSGKIASLGWCFGGGQSLQLALAGEPLDATIIYYGSLITDTNKLSKIGWPVLGIFGEADTSIPVATVRAFETGLNDAGVESQVHVYPNVGHAFANPSGMNYAPAETADAWKKTLDFLKANISGS